MAIDSIQGARRAALIRMKATPALTSLVPAARIYGQSAGANPTWPFIKWGAATSLPRRSSCLDAATITGSVHAFAGPRLSSSGAKLETGEDHASRIGLAIAKALDGFYGDVPGGVARFQWTRTQLLVDGDEADAFHAIVNFTIRCSTNSG